MRQVLSTALDVALVLLIAGGVALIHLPSGLITLGVLGLAISVWRNR